MTKKKASLWQVLKSVAASVLGVQSQANYESDFEQRSFVPYLIVGILFVAALIATLLLIVKLSL